MSNSIRIALPGINAFTDTDPNNFALDPDNTTNILIKENTRGSVTLAAGASQTIAHNLGYIPFYLVYGNGNFIVNGNNESGYMHCSAGGTVSPPTFEAYVDSTNLYIVNNQSSSATFWYYLFYDNVSGASSNNIALSKTAVRVALAGKNALTSKDPNDFKFHSDFNTFKILRRDFESIDTISGSNIYTIAHGALSSTPLFIVFAQFPDGKVLPLSFPSSKSYNNASSGADGHSIDQCWWDSTNIYFYVASVGTGYHIDFVIFELEPELV